ncbi:MAG: hypothetical protein DMG06_07765 [Acidobacteria bacterium]|nr:MAG: hypothetical protein DMG06_07765 [Acidobacteriota bacterium]
MLKFSALLPRAFRQLPDNDELREKLVLSLWKQAVGEPLAQRTKPFRLFKSTLIVSVPSLMWKRELHHLEAEILKSLHQATGRRIVFALEFRVDPQFDAETPPAQPQGVSTLREPVALPLETIQDTELRQSLAAAVSSYLNRLK